MGNKTSLATLILNVKSSKAVKALNSASGGLKRFINSAKSLAFPLAVAGTAIAAVTTAIGALALKSDELTTVKRSFEALAASQGQSAQKMLTQMRDLSKGTISDLELMKQANTALMLGLPVDKFGDMLTIARSASKATGQSMEFMLNSIVTGLGRGSKLMLDNLGILVDATSAQETYAKSLGKTAAQLTDAEKKTAFINAALKAGIKNVEASGGSADNLTDSWERLKTTAVNLALEFGTKLAPAFKAAFDIANKALSIFGGQTQLAKSYSDQVAELTTQLNVQTAARKELQRQIKGAKSEAFLEPLGEEKTAIELSIIATKKKIKAIQDLEAAEKKAGSDKAARDSAALALQQENDAIKAEQDIINKEEQAENERLFDQAMTDEKLAALYDRQSKIIQSNASHNAKLIALKTKQNIKETAIENQRDLETRQRRTNLAKFQKFMNSEELKGTAGFLNSLQGLSQSSHRDLVILAKVASIASIGISTARAAMNNYAWASSWGGPAAGAVAAGAAIAAGATQMAAASGIALAEGGIVQPTPGGTLATIGEAGKPEAVIPLDEGEEQLGGVGGTTVNITVNGGMLGTPDEAREFAVAIDKELFELQRSNESLSLPGVV